MLLTLRLILAQIVSGIWQQGSSFVVMRLLFVHNKGHEKVRSNITEMKLVANRHEKADRDFVNFAVYYVVPAWSAK